MKKALLIIFIISAVNITQAQNNDVINIGVYGEGNRITSSHIDSLGNTIVSVDVGQSLHVASFDPSNNVNWSREIYTSSTNSSGKIYPSISGDFFVRTHHHVFKLDANGLILWSYELQNPINGIQEGCPLPNGGFALMGMITYDFQSTLIVLKADGTVDWSKKIVSPTTFSIPRQILVTPQGNILTFCNQGGVSSYLFTTWGAAGNVISEKQFEANTTAYTFGHIHSAKITSNGHLYLTGIRGGDVGVLGTREIAIYHFDENLNFVNGKTYGSIYDDEGWDLVEDEEGMLIAICMAKPQLVCSGLLKVMRLTPSLDTLYTRHYGSIGNGFLFTEVKRKDSIIYASGWGSFLSVPFAGSSGHLIKTNHDFNLSCGHFPFSTEINTIEQLISPNHNMQYITAERIFTSFIYEEPSLLAAQVVCSGPGPSLSVPDLEDGEFTFAPNPVSSKFEIKHPTFYNEMNIYNVQGELIIHQKLNGDQTRVNCEELKSGVYFVRLSGYNQVATKKMVKR